MGPSDPFTVVKGQTDLTHLIIVMTEKHHKKCDKLSPMSFVILVIKLFSNIQIALFLGLLSVCIFSNFSWSSSLGTFLHFLLCESRVKFQEKYWGEEGVTKKDTAEILIFQIRHE